MKNISLLFVFVAVLSAIGGCKEGQECGGLRLQVNLAEQSVSWNELFSHLEVIPLETQDSCLIMDIEKIIPCQEQMYVFDQRKPAVYVFGKNGEFLHEIAKKGEGPGEYQALTDVFWDEADRQVVLLIPLGHILVYDMEGRFIAQKALPVKPNYYSVSSLRDDAFVLWSCVEENETGLSVIDKDSMTMIYETWHNDRMLDMGLMKPFYQYGGETYFSTAYQQTVYHVKKDSLVAAYSWDFGTGNIPSRQLLAYTEIENAGERNDKILKDLEEGILPYAMERHNETDDYYYVALRKGVGFNRPWINVFYRKSDGRFYVFGQTAEGIHVHPILFSSDFLLSMMSPGDIDAYSRVLSEAEYAKLARHSAEDNPCLIKFYFK